MSVTLPSTYDSYRPFGSGTPSVTNSACLFVGDYVRSRRTTDPPGWTHYMIVDVADDVIDGVIRAGGSNTLTYADGDEVRVPTGATTPTYVVVWVAPYGDDGTQKIVYLMRHLP